MGEQKRDAELDSGTGDNAPAIARLHIWQIQAVRDSLVILAVFGVIWAGYAMRAVTVPLLVALMLAYLFEPLVARLTQYRGFTRPKVVALLLFTVGMLVVVLLAIFIPVVIRQSIRLVDDLRAGRFERTLIQLKEYLPEAYRADAARVLTWLSPSPLTELGDFAAGIADSESQLPATRPDFTPPTLDDESRLRQIVREELAAQSVADTATVASPSWWGWAERGGRAVWNLLAAVIRMGLLAFLIPFYFFFFSVSWPSVVNFVQGLIPPRNRGRALELIYKMDRAVAGFVRGRIVICVLMGIMLAAGWMLCGVPYAIVLGLIVGAFSIVPYLGGIGIPLAIGLLAMNELSDPPDQRMAWWAIILWPSAVFMIVQVVETYFLTPVIAGKATNLDPVTILVAVLAGGSVGGVYGMILAIPVAACVKILLTEVLLPRLRAWARGEVEDPLPFGGG